MAGSTLRPLAADTAKQLNEQAEALWGERRRRTSWVAGGHGAHSGGVARESSRQRRGVGFLSLIGWSPPIRKYILRHGR